MSRTADDRQFIPRPATEPQPAVAPAADPAPGPLRLWCRVLYPLHCLMRLTLAATFPLFSHEGHCWEWSRFPQWGYLEHPPMAAWLIASTAWLFPPGSLLGVRLWAVVLGSLSPLLVYWLARVLFGDERVALWSLLLSLGLPVFTTVGFMMLPDTPMIFFALGGLVCFGLAVFRGRTAAWYGAGLLLGLALLSKVTAALLVPACGIFLCLSGPHRFWLGRKEPYLALALALAVSSPFLLWNFSHGWPTLAFQLRDRHGPEFGFGLDKLLETTFEQPPNTFIFLFIAFVVAVLLTPSSRFRPQWQQPYKFLRVLPLTVVFFFLALGSVTETHPHWSLLAYPPAMVAVATFPVARPRHSLSVALPWLVGCTLGSWVIATGVLLYADSTIRPINPYWLGDTMGGKIAMTQQAMFGWDELSRGVSDRLKDTGAADPVIFTNRWDIACMLSFERGEQVRDIAPLLPPGRGYLNSSQRYYLNLADLAGRSGLFVGDADGPTIAELRRLFDVVEPLVPVRVEYNSGLVIDYPVYAVKGLRFARGQGAGQRAAGHGQVACQFESAADGECAPANRQGTVTVTPSPPTGG